MFTCESLSVLIQTSPTPQKAEVWSGSFIRIFLRFRDHHTYPSPPLLLKLHALLHAPLFSAGNRLWGGGGHHPLLAY